MRVIVAQVKEATAAAICLPEPSNISAHLSKQSVHYLVGWRGERALPKLKEITQRHVHHHAHWIHSNRSFLTFAAPKQSCHLRHEVLEQRLEHQLAAWVIQPLAWSGFAIQDGW